MITFSEQKNNIYCLKSVFGVTATPCNKWYYMMWHEVKRILIVYLGKSIPYSLYLYPEFICRSCKTRITSEMSINEIPDMFNWWHIWWIYRPWKKLYGYADQKSQTFLATCDRALSCRKITTEMPWRNEIALGSSSSPNFCCCSDYPIFVTAAIIHDLQLHPKL